MGVDKVIYFDDSSDDDPDGGTATVRKFVDSGFLEVRDATRWDDQFFIFASDFTVKPTTVGNRGLRDVLFSFDKQQKAAIEVWKEIRRRDEPRRHVWIGLLDVDEFYNPFANSKNPVALDTKVSTASAHTLGTAGSLSLPLKRLLRAARMRQVKSIRCPKIKFGPGGHVERPLTLRASYLFRDKHRPAKHTGLALAWAITGMAPGCSHIFMTSSLVVDALFGRHECNDWHGDGTAGPSGLGTISNGVLYSANESLVVNHYATKSISECLERGARAHPDGAYVPRECTSARYRKCDDSIVNYLPKREQKGMSKCSENERELYLAAEKARISVLLRNSTVDLCSFPEFSLSWEEEVACGLREPPYWYQGVVPKVQPGHVWRTPCPDDCVPPFGNSNIPRNYSKNWEVYIGS